MLKKVKILLGIPADDASLDERLNLIIENTRSRLKLLLGKDPPEDLSYRPCLEMCSRPFIFGAIPQGSGEHYPQ